MINRFKPDVHNHYSDIDEEHFFFPKLGKCLLKNTKPWQDNTRTDIITFNPNIHTEELNKNFVIGNSVNDNVKSKIISIVKKYWDSFCSEGARRPILGYEFAINTGSHTPVCKCLSLSQIYPKTKLPETQLHNYQISNTKYQISNIKYQNLIIRK